MRLKLQKVEFGVGCGGYDVSAAMNTTFWFWFWGVFFLVFHTCKALEGVEKV